MADAPQEPSVRLVRHPDEQQRVALLDLVRRAADAGDDLDDLLTADLAHGPAADSYLAAVVDDADGNPCAYAQASEGNEGMVVGVVSTATPPERLRLHRTALAALLDALPPEHDVTWWPSIADEPLATRLGLHPDRRLLRMEAPLPLAATTDVATRPFRVGEDEGAWLDVNNAAFHWHGEQGGWDHDTLRRREQEPWFDPAGFLLHERDGRLAAFCWTKRHDDGVGEVYVIAVHPDFHGLGLGRALTVAGFDHQYRHGATCGMLFVDDGNSNAVRLYESLGLQAVAARQSYHRHPGVPR